MKRLTLFAMLAAVGCQPLDNDKSTGKDAESKEFQAVVKHEFWDQGTTAKDVEKVVDELASRGGGWLAVTNKGKTVFGETLSVAADTLFIPPDDLKSHLKGKVFIELPKAGKRFTRQEAIQVLHDEIRRYSPGIAYFQNIRRSRRQATD